MEKRRARHTGFEVLMAIGAALVVAACTRSSASTTGGASPEPTSGSFSSANLGSVGDVLVGADGSTLYLFTPEQGGTIACTGSCATTWPAVVTPDAKSASASGGADSSMLGTVKLANGQFEVTYNGWPLHTYAGDTAMGQVNGQGIGGQWFAVTTSGNAAGSAGAGSGGAGSGGGSGSNSGW